MTLLRHHLQLVRLHLFNLWAEEVLRSSLACALKWNFHLTVVKWLAWNSRVAFLRANVTTSWSYFLALLLANVIFASDTVSIVADFRASMAARKVFSTLSSTGNNVQVTRNISPNFLSTVTFFFSQHSARRAAFIRMTIVVNCVVAAVLSSADLLTLGRLLATLNWRVCYLLSTVASKLVKGNVQASPAISSMTNLLAPMSTALKHSSARFRANMRVRTAVKSIWAAQDLACVPPAAHFLLAGAFTLCRFGIHEIDVAVDE